MPKHLSREVKFACLICLISSILLVNPHLFAAMPNQTEDAPMVQYKTVSIEGLDIFYREAGAKDKATVLLLHGFPT